MTLREAIVLMENHQNRRAERTRESYRYALRSLEVLLGDMAFETINPQDLYQFLLLITEGRARSTARLPLRPDQGFSNFIIEISYLSIPNPCSDPLLANISRHP